MLILCVMLIGYQLKLVINVQPLLPHGSNMHTKVKSSALTYGAVKRALTHKPVCTLYQQNNH